MVDGKAAEVEEFALHRIGSGDTPSVFSDFTVVLKGEEEHEFLHLFGALAPYITPSMAKRRHGRERSSP